MPHEMNSQTVWAAATSVDIPPPAAALNQRSLLQANTEDLIPIAYCPVQLRSNDSDHSSSRSISFSPLHAVPARNASRSPTRSKPSYIGRWFQGESAPVSFGMSSPQKESGNPTESTQQPSGPYVAKESASEADIPRTFGIGNLLTRFGGKQRPCSPTSEKDTGSDLQSYRSVDHYRVPDVHAPSTPETVENDARNLPVRAQSRLEAAVRRKEPRDSVQTADEMAEWVQHSKAQLDAMSLKVVEQDKEVATLRKDLARERRLRRKEARERTLRIVYDESAERSDGTYRRGSHSSLDSAPALTSDSEDEASSERNSGPSSPSLSLAHLTATPIPTTSHSKGREMADPYFLVPDTAVVQRENAMLRARVDFLEKELDGCLDLVRAIGITK